MNKVTAEARINSPEIEYQILRLPMKSTEVSPLYNRPPRPENFAITSPLLPVVFVSQRYLTILLKNQITDDHY